MAKQIQGECNWCGHCGCYSGEQNDNRWCPGLPVCLFNWYLQHPDPVKRKFFQYIIEKIGYYPGYTGYEFVTIPGIGRVNFYISEEGIQVSETDKSCPCFDKDTHECILWGTEYYPDVCADIPHNLSEEQIAAWEVDHPDCGYYWVDV